MGEVAACGAAGWGRLVRRYQVLSRPAAAPGRSSPPRGAAPAPGPSPPAAGRRPTRSRGGRPGSTAVLAHCPSAWTRMESEPAQVKVPDTKRGFVLLSCRWVVERSHTSCARFRRLAQDYE